MYRRLLTGHAARRCHSRFARWSALNEERRFSAFFEQATSGNVPMPYQERLAVCDSLPSLVDVPTDLGKAAAAVLAWVTKRTP